MNINLLSSVFIFVINVKLCQSKSYSNYSLYVATPTHFSHLKFLRDLEMKHYFDVLFWKHSFRFHDSVQMMVHEKDEYYFLERFQHYNLTAEMSLSNVQDAFDNQTIGNYTPFVLDTFSWDSYHNLDDITQWLKDLARSSQAVHLHTIGKSAEGREIIVIEVNSLKKYEKKPVVIVEGGIHGNEWISITFVTYLIDGLRFADTYSNMDLRKLAHEYCWYLIPVANPDGFVYSYEEDRLWRKNRRRLQMNSDIFGVDLNRNFDFSFGNDHQWQTKMLSLVKRPLVAGFYFLLDGHFWQTRHFLEKIVPENQKTPYIDSNDEKNDFYCGKHPFSEPESKALADFIEKKADDLKFYFAIHAYGEKIIIPYSDRVMHMDNYDETANFAAQASAAMYELNGIVYDVGTNFDVFGGKISGNSACWVKQKLETKYVYTMVLRDNGTYGYALPADQIRPACKEAMIGLLKIMSAKIRPAMRNSEGVYVLVNKTPKQMKSNEYLMLCFYIMLTQLNVL